MAEATERMSRVDTAWLRMDNDVNLMMIVGVWLIEPAIGYAALCERIEDKLFKYERFRQKVVRDTIGANWAADDDFDIARHVVIEKLPRGRGKAGAHDERPRDGNPDERQGERQCDHDPQ